MESSPSLEIKKLQTHLDLLRQEYTKLQKEIERRENGPSLSWSALLCNTVSSLYYNTQFSDMKIQLKDESIPGHKLVFSARNIQCESGILDWDNIAQDIGAAIVKYIYTDQIDLGSSEEFQLQLMRTAYKLKLNALTEKCEVSLIKCAAVENCVAFYMAAEEVAASNLRNHASNLISTYWDELSSEDFKEMGAPLLYSMLKEKSEGSVLHSAVHLHREDVVFLFLVENTANVPTLVNSVDKNGELVLDIALRNKQIGIAETLIKHKADVNAKDSQGWSLLLKSIHRGDLSASKFLLDHDASISCTTPTSYDSALHLIATQADATRMITVANCLLERGLSPDLKNVQGQTPLHLSVCSRNDEMFALLLSRNVDLNINDVKGHTPLFYACLNLTHENSVTQSFASRLIEKGSNPNPSYDDQSTLLHHLIEQEKEYPAIFISSYATNFEEQDGKGLTVLHVAAEKGLCKLVRKLIDSGANLNAQSSPILTQNGGEDRHKVTPLHCAILNSRTDVVEILLQQKESVNVNLLDSKGDSPLSLALACNLHALVPGLVHAGANLNIRNIEGLTLLHQMIVKADCETALTLISNGADIDARTFDGKSALDLCLTDARLLPVVEALCKRGVDMSTNCPLWVALEHEQIDIASILVRYGVDTNCWAEGPEECQQTLLHKAIDENNETAAQFLIQSGCDLNSPRRPGPGGRGGDEARDNQSPLHLCCQWGLENVVQSLMEHGAQLNTQDAEGRTPLHVAISNGHTAIINLLLLHPNTDLSIRDKSGHSPFYTALTVRNNTAAKRILELLPSAAEQFDARGKNFLHLAIQKGDIESVLFLLSVNVDVNSRVQDSVQNTPLHLAAMQPNDLLVRNLLLAGARIDERNNQKKNALHIATENGHPEVVSALLQNGIDFNATDNEGDNALHIACHEGHASVVQVLLTESQIDADALNLKGRSPLHVLAYYCKEHAADIADLFIELMPGYKLDKRDSDGNTALMLAYMKGNGPLCRTLAKARACVGEMNKHGITIFNYQVATKTLLFRLLESLTQEPPWAEADICSECGTKFGLTMRKHHCRHCGRVLCSKCSSQEVPILKFSLNKPVRVCEVCVKVISGIIK